MTINKLPLVFACYGKPNTIENIFKHKAILSKKELKKRRINFQENSSNMEIESFLGTEDDVTLYIDITFKELFMYGGLIGPRFLFNRDLLYENGVFILPSDQSTYFKEGNVLYEEFERDKHISKKDKDELIDECIKSNGSILLEVHVPTKIDFKWLDGMLVYHKDFEEYVAREELKGVSTIAVNGRKDGGALSDIPDAISFQEAYKMYLKSYDFEN